MEKVRGDYAAGRAPGEVRVGALDLARWRLYWECTFPRVLGQNSSDLLESKEPRKYPVIFEGLEKDTDSFEFTLPSGYEVDDLPPPEDMDYSFASYHSKTEVSGRTLKYARTMEIKELSVPLSKLDDLKKFTA